VKTSAGSNFEEEQLAIELGMTVKDKITGLKGVVVCICSYLSGCDRASIQPLEIVNGKPAEWVTFDVLQLDIVSSAKKIVIGREPITNKTGGPRPNPQQW
jgi:hypothetical protein